MSPFNSGYKSGTTRSSSIILDAEDKVRGSGPTCLVSDSNPQLRTPSSHSVHQDTYSSQYLSQYHSGQNHSSTSTIPSHTGASGSRGERDSLSSLHSSPNDSAYSESKNYILSPKLSLSTNTRRKGSIASDTIDFIQSLDQSLDKSLSKQSTMRSSAPIESPISPRGGNSFRDQLDRAYMGKFGEHEETIHENPRRADDSQSINSVRTDSSMQSLSAYMSDMKLATSNNNMGDDAKSVRSVSTTTSRGRMSSEQFLQQIQRQNELSSVSKYMTSSPEKPKIIDLRANANNNQGVISLTSKPGYSDPMQSSRTSVNDTRDDFDFKDGGIYGSNGNGIRGRAKSNVIAPTAMKASK